MADARHPPTVHARSPSRARVVADRMTHGKAGNLRSRSMSAQLARNWWVIGLRAAAAGVFVLAILLAPRPAVASFVILFAAYIAADGLFAILAGARAARRGERWWILIAEGATNLAVAGGVLVWPAIAAAPFIHLASAWAIVTGALMLAVARRLVGSHGRWLLTLAGVVSAAWGAVATTIGPAFVTDASVGIFLVGYALLFGAVLSALTVRLRRRHREAQPGADAEPSEGASPRP